MRIHKCTSIELQYRFKNPLNLQRSLGNELWSKDLVPAAFLPIIVTKARLECGNCEHAGG